MCLEFIVDAIIKDGIRLNDEFIPKRYADSHTHILFMDEARFRIYEWTAEIEGKYVTLKTFKQLINAIKKEHPMWYKINNNGMGLFSAIAQYGSYHFSFFEDHIDPFKEKAEKITLDQLAGGLLLDQNHLYFIDNTSQGLK